MWLAPTFLIVFPVVIGVVYVCYLFPVVVKLGAAPAVAVPVELVEIEIMQWSHVIDTLRFHRNLLPRWRSGNKCHACGNE
jgi:hypothetical protein